MNVINIIKPDALNNEVSLRYYFKNVINIENIKSIKLYYMDNWTKIASMIYEYDVMMSSGNCLELRKKLLTSIMGYYHIYPKNNGIVVLFNINDINNDNITTSLQKLYQLKKDIRKKYVSNTDLYYLKFLNEDDITFDKPLYDIDLSGLKVDIKKFPANFPYDDPAYKMIFFNQIHGPNPNSLDEIKHSVKILNNEDVINEKRLMKVLKNEI
ncbi:MAG TPA: hypothetical protein IAB38_01305 [Candidatus Onthousia excrementipullorum]|uniref:Nucleoside diphosphate kinase n=1 Tax=Candidatus Onthousia excrementipullorum TaxID=2840884 RepID=A0A9D1DT81_9FIRM|nr:hypothetical protein [Candidatus Onthousia excrementipullorum]